MIRSTDECIDITTANPFNIRIKALHNAYHGTEICRFYIDTDTSCRMAQFGRVMIIASVNPPDEKLLFDFCQMAGVKIIICDGELSFSHGAKTEGYILMHNGVNSASSRKNIKTVFSENLRDIFPLIKDNMNGLLSDDNFDEFYVDLSHRIRHGCGASVIVYNEQDIPVSCAVAPFMCDDGAVISAVCTNKDCRNMGYASHAIYSLIDKLRFFDIENIYLQINDNSLLDFYYPLGFTASGTWQEITL